MIYLKRLGLIILAFLSILVGTIITLLLVITTPVWGIGYFIFTGNDPLKEDVFDYLWNIITKLLDWYCNKYNLC